MKANRIKIAYVLAPMFPTLFLLVVSYVGGLSAFQFTFLIVLFSLTVSYLSSALLGFPFVKFLRKRKALSFTTVVTGGALLGVFVNYLFGFGFSALLDSSMSSMPRDGVLMSGAWGAAFGVMVALPFSLIAGLPCIPSKQSE